MNADGRTTKLLCPPANEYMQTNWGKVHNYVEIIRERINPAATRFLWEGFHVTNRLEGSALETIAGMLELSSVASHE